MMLADKHDNYWSGVRGVNTTQPSVTADRKALFAVIPLVLYLTPRTPDATVSLPVGEVNP